MQSTFITAESDLTIECTRSNANLQLHFLPKRKSPFSSLDDVDADQISHSLKHDDHDSDVIPRVFLECIIHQFVAHFLSICFSFQEIHSFLIRHHIPQLDLVKNENLLENYPITRDDQKRIGLIEWDIIQIWRCDEPHILQFHITKRSCDSQTS
jgi:hypothetical protein